MRIRRSQKEQMRETGHGHVIGELTGALEQLVVLNAANVFAAAEGAKAASADFGFMGSSCVCNGVQDFVSL